MVELRLLLSDLWDSVHRIYRSIDLTVYVDDTGLEARGTFKHIISAFYLFRRRRWFGGCGAWRWNSATQRMSSLHRRPRWLSKWNLHAVHS